MQTGKREMELSALIESQLSADIRRGFEAEFDTDEQRVAQLEKDLVGLMGEVGEFANILKKIRLAATHAKYEGPSLETAAPVLREELADAFIYLMRLSVILKADLEADVVQKMRANEHRYGPLEER
jgi:NTP pyrophosphatase (non-canonical NTP hydrolase)